MGRLYGLPLPTKFRVASNPQNMRDYYTKLRLHVATAGERLAADGARSGGVPSDGEAVITYLGENGPRGPETPVDCQAWIVKVESSPGGVLTL